MKKYVILDKDSSGNIIEEPLATLEVKTELSEKQLEEFVGGIEYILKKFKN